MYCTKDWRSGGSLFAGATAGGGVSAAAGLGGVASEEGAVGTKFAGASSGGLHVMKVAHKVHSPAYVSGSLNIHKEVAPVVVQKEVVTKVQPQYVDKVIQVPSYVEKTIRVPTVVEKTIRVPVEPIVEKEITYQAPVVQKVKYVQKTKVHHPHHVHFRKYFGFGTGGGYGGGYGAGYGGEAAAGAGGAVATNAGAGFGGSSSYNSNFAYKSNPQFYNDIFNIPISTLGAVNKLVNGLAGGAEGSVSVSKSYKSSY